MKNCMLLWREAHFEVRMCKTHHCRTTFGRRTPLWREAHVETKVLKTDRLRPLLEVEMSKKCTPLWREAHFEVKMPKTPAGRSAFRNCDVQKVHGVVARSAFGSEHAKDTTCSRHFWALKRRFVWQAQGFLHLNK